MVEGSCFKNILYNIWLRRTIRIIVGLLFVYAGFIKIPDIGAFTRQIMVYDILPWSMVNLFALWLVSLEVIAGLFLILGIWIRPASIIIAGLCFMFLVAISSALARDIPLRCGCFSVVPSDDPRSWLSLWRETALFSACIWLWLTENAPHSFNSDK